jgi:NAD(P)-dependent dehydrogenase (short-subunit alcohol dehydrogenase family)
VGFATALGAAGARVAVNYSSDREGAERVAQAITDNGGEAITVGADVSKAAEVARLFKEVDSAFGRLDVLVNNAGVFRFGAFAQTEWDGSSVPSQTVPPFLGAGTEYPREAFEERASKVKVLPVTIQDR